MVLIHLVTAGVGMLEKLKDSFFTGKRRPSEAFQQPEQVIALHKFGGASAGDDNLLNAYKSRVASINREFEYEHSYSNSLRKNIQIHLHHITLTHGKSPAST